MTDQDVTAEVAPYMSAKNEKAEKKSSKTGLIIPVVLSLVLAIVLAASFFGNEYKSLIANFSPDADLTPMSEETIVANTVEDSNTTAAIPATTDNEVLTTSTVVKEDTPTTAPTTSQSKLITVYNPYLRPYPQVYAPIPIQVPQGMPPQQAQAYTVMMQQRQKMVADFYARENAIRTSMEQRAQAQKTHAEMLTKRQAANSI